jgi:hypothetical protein
MNDDPPPIEPEPEPPPPDQPPPELSPLRTDSTPGTTFIESAGRGCLGMVSFIPALQMTNVSNVAV